MHVLQALQVLVDDVLFVNVFEDIGADYSMQVCVHEIKHKVNIAVILCANYILEADNVLMARQLLQKDDFAEGTLCVGRILEGIKVLLESDNILGAFVNSLPDYTISSLSYRQISIKVMKNFFENRAKNSR